MSNKNNKHDKAEDPQRSDSAIPGFYSGGNSLPERDADCLSLHSR